MRSARVDPQPDDRNRCPLVRVLPSARPRAAVLRVRASIPHDLDRRPAAAEGSRPAVDGVLGRALGGRHLRRRHGRSRRPRLGGHVGTPDQHERARPGTLSSSRVRHARAAADDHRSRATTRNRSAATPRSTGCRSKKRSTNGSKPSACRRKKRPSTKPSGTRPAASSSNVERLLGRYAEPIYADYSHRGRDGVLVARHDQVVRLAAWGAAARRGGRRHAPRGGRRHRDDLRRA